MSAATALPGRRSTPATRPAMLGLRVAAVILLLAAGCDGDGSDGDGDDLERRCNGSVLEYLRIARGEEHWKYEIDCACLLSECVDDGERARCEPGESGVPASGYARGEFPPLQCSASTCRDPSSGLVWQRVPGGPKIFGWGSSARYCDELVLDALDDWRLPSLDELRSLIRGCWMTEATAVATCEYDADPENDCAARCGDCCEGCEPYRGPGDGGCYWPPGLGGTCVDDAPNGYRDTYPVSEAGGAIAFRTGAYEYFMEDDALTQVRCVRSD